MKNKQLVKFYPTSKEIERLVPAPKPAKSFIPQWYKSSTSFYNSNTMSFGADAMVEKTIKLCIPVLDALTMGYIQPSWTDVHISQTNDTCKFSYASKPTIVGTRDAKSLQNIPIPEGFFEAPLHWLRPWVAKVPSGYSVLITHPMYREDLPFRCVTGVIDSDDYIDSGKVSFFIKKGFNGVIPFGTPLFQIIPFKRNNWKSSIESYDSWGNLNLSKESIFKYFVGGYKHLYWKKKTYE